MQRFSIRTLLIVTALVAVAVALPIRRAILQHYGREWVAAQRGHVGFKHNYESKHPALRKKADSSRAFMRYLIAVFGVDLFDKVTSVVFDCDELVDLAPLRNLPWVETIMINIDMADEIDFSPLAEMPRLREIHFTKWSNLTEKKLIEVRDLLPHVEIHAETRSKH